MKKILFHLPVTLFFLLAFFSSCQKDAKEINAESETNTVRSGNSGGCRMTTYYYYDAINDFEQVDRFSYKNGFLDEWTVSYGLVAKLEYNANGRMKIARMYDGTSLAYTINFIYKNNKIVKEIWYLEDTEVVDDVVEITYDQKGQMIKNESINYGFHTLYTYSNDGSVENFTVYVGDSPVVKGEYTSSQRYKNPYKSVQGLEYAFAYSNSGLFSGSWWYSSERWIVFDENGTPTIYYDLDPKQTVWTPAMQNYPQQADYTDVLTGGEILNNFEYENCSPGQSGNALRSYNGTVNRNNASESLMSILSGPKAEFISKINLLRNKN